MKSDPNVSNIVQSAWKCKSAQNSNFHLHRCLDGILITKRVPEEKEVLGENFVNNRNVMTKASLLIQRHLLWLLGFSSASLIPSEQKGIHDTLGESNTHASNSWRNMSLHSWRKKAQDSQGLCVFRIEEQN